MVKSMPLTAVGISMFRQKMNLHQRKLNIKSFNILEIILSFNNREVGLWQLQVSITAVTHRIMLQIIEYCKSR